MACAIILKREYTANGLTLHIKFPKGNKIYTYSQAKVAEADLLEMVRLDANGYGMTRYMMRKGINKLND